MKPKPSLLKRSGKMINLSPNQQGKKGRENKQETSEPMNGSGKMVINSVHIKRIQGNIMNNFI